VVHHPF